MRKVTFYCDRCKKEIKDAGIELQGGSLDTETEKWISMTAIRLHFHPSCLDDLIADLDGAKKEKIAPVQKKEKKPKKTVDRDTVKALYLANWKIKDIAEDPKVKCSEWTVRNIIRELREAGEIE